MERTIEIERRKNESDRRAAAEAREERNYLTARRRIMALEKALDMIVGSLKPHEHAIDLAKIAQFRQGVDIARSLLGTKPPGSSAAPAPATDPPRDGDKPVPPFR